MNTRFPNKNYDLLVIGGGINGAAIANIAAAAGARVALVEKGDWAGGTSSKSTKLLHGGIRYLENFEFGLVAESLKERFIQWKSAPHLVKPMRFIVPVYRAQGRPFWMMKLGVWLYERLSGAYSLGPHAVLSKEEVERLAPGIKAEGLLGGVSYFDAQMDDARLCLENVLMAQKRGADVANYVEAVEFLKENGHAVGMRLRDTVSGGSFNVRADKIIVAAGPWSDIVRHTDMPAAQARLRPTKGVHIVCRIDGEVPADAFLLQNLRDKRIFFTIPFKGNVLIGTTDTDFKKAPENVRVEQSDVDYLLNEARANFPARGLTQDHIIAAFAGVRPLVYEPGSPSKVSRRHVIERNSSGVYYVMGGKYTTYRAIALECVALVLPRLARHVPATEDYMLYGSGLGNPDMKSIALRYAVEAQTINYLVSVYGSRFEDVLKLTQTDPSLKAAICTCSKAIRAQVVYALQTEMARTPADIFERRLELGYNNCLTKQCRQVIERMLLSGIIKHV
ncbi:MAG: glycerol-3-phosphate dehydrogenase/oxidase [Candidatus Omnitrophica bacterium]|nr:glycerol-3-phosphate dehydrogenase/oxidase [Candidatus Omnitrophota bacterium]